jgi:sugar O-acyltransferase (sialic acid O-acetyltransferase NeuD family)
MTELTRIVIVGAGGLGREVLATLRVANAARKQANVLGFLDSTPGLFGTEVSGIPVLGDDTWCRNNSDSSLRFICAIGDPKIRYQVVNKLSAMNCKFASVVHPDVRIPNSVKIGDGTVIMAGTQFTTDVTIGSHVVVYVNCSITHDVRVGDFCVIPSGCTLSGESVLEEGVLLGAGVNVLPRKRIGAWAIIGAGSVVTRDIPGNTTAVGVPCRVIHEHHGRHE